MSSEIQSTEKSEVAPAKQGWWKRLSGPVKIGIFFATVAIIMAVVGLIKDSADNPVTLRGMLVAILISGGTWGLISWAIATAAVEVERDVAARQDKDEQEGDSSES